MILSYIGPTFGRFEAPILTTQDYFTEALSDKGLEEMPERALRLNRIQKQERHATVAKYVWLATIVLPIIYAVGRLIFKPNIVQQRRAEITALRQSIKEFGEILEIVGCKKEREEERQGIRTHNWHVYDIRHDALDAFRKPYKNDNVLLEAVFKSTQNMLKLFSANFGVDGRNLATDRESDPINSYAHYIGQINRSSVASVRSSGSSTGIRYLKGDEAFARGWDFLTAQKERLMALCSARLDSLK